MAKNKDNKKTYRPIKNPELLGGKKESIQQILDRGSQGKPENVKHAEHEMQKREEAKTTQRPNIEAKVAEYKKRQEQQKTDVAKEVQEKKKEKDIDKNR